MSPGAWFVVAVMAVLACCVLGEWLSELAARARITRERADRALGRIRALERHLGIRYRDGRCTGWQPDGYVTEAQYQAEQAVERVARRPVMPPNRVIREGEE